MHSLADLYLAHGVSPETQDRLTLWSAAIDREPEREPGRWHMHFQRWVRSATVTASTNIEGNPMSVPQVDALLSGEAVNAPQLAQVENLNYNRALDLATAFAITPSFEWQEATVTTINSMIMHGLPEDRLGRYRDVPVHVARIYQAPDHGIVPALMGGFVDWLGDCDEHPLVRAALLHLNLVAIHPFADGNGRTARVLTTLDLMRSGVRAPELLSVEPYLAAHRDEYFDRLATTLGPTYRPEDHSATEWVEYYVRISTALLDVRERIDQAFPFDLGLLADFLHRRSQPASWGMALHMAATFPVRTRDIATTYERSQPWARNLLNRLADAGYLRHDGRTRASQWFPTELLQNLDLRVPALVRQYEQGMTLGLVA